MSFSRIIRTNALNRVVIGCFLLTISAHCLAQTKASRIDTLMRSLAERGQFSGSTRDVTVIKGATLIDGTGRQPSHSAVIVIDGERIRTVGVQGKIKIPRGARIIDAGGKFIIPGLIDCHCHMEMVGLGSLADLPPEWEKADKRRQLTLINARLDLLSGVTTVRDLGSTDLLFKVRDEINSGSQIGPRILAAGHQLVKKQPGAYMDQTFIEYEGPDDARQKVRQEIALGADWIKIRLTHRQVRPLPSVEEMRAIVEEAHRLGRRVAVHTDVPDDEAVQLAINVGVDSIEHNAPFRAKDAKLLSQMAQKGIALMAGAGGFYVQRFENQDTKNALDPGPKRLLPQELVSILYRVAASLHEQTDQMKKSGWDANQVQARFIRDVQRARKAGVLLIFGTDCGADLMVNGQQYKALYGETQMGSTPMEALLMATRDAAKILGKQNELGTVEPGKMADLVILEGNPLADLRNLGNVYAVMKGGRLYKPTELFEGQK
jgi:imidazolonepropionase-like amidohydrolase